MADHLRRSTMKPSADPFGNARSGLPVPTTIKKPAANRMSLSGPAATRTTLQPPGSNHRKSIYRSQNVNPLLQSASKPKLGRTPLNNSTARRGSLWPGAPTFSQPSSSQPAKDTRPLREKNYQSKMRQDIHAYLTSGGLDFSMQRLTNIQGKDYRTIFELLLVDIDPSYPLNTESKFEEEFVPALKSIMYPYAHQIDNKWLAAPASMHSWPTLLGVIHWMVELCKARSQYFGSGHPSLQITSDIPEEFDDPLDHRAVAFEYFEESYHLWMSMHDDVSEPKEMLENRYGKRLERIQHDLAEDLKQLDEAKLEYERLKSSAAPIAKLEKENGLLMGDSEKFKKILHQYEARKKKLLDNIIYEKTELATRGQQLEQLQAEQRKLSEVVKMQNLSPEEAQQMTTEHEMLTRNLEDLKQKVSETHRALMSLEVSVTNRAAATEEALDVYTNLLSTLDLLSPLPKPLPDIDLTLELNTAAPNPHNLLIGADIRKLIKPTLNNVAELKRSERASIESERIKVDNELDQITQDCETLEEEISEMERKIAALNEQADDLRDAAQQEASVATGEAERLERDVAQARQAAWTHGMGVKTRLQKLQFGYREQVEKVTRLKDETVRAIIKNSHDIAIFKDEVSRHLRELREFAELD